MAVENKHFTWSFVAGEDMDSLNKGTGALHKAVDGAKTIAANGSEAIGLLKYVGKSDEHVTIAPMGITKYVASAAISAGAVLTVTTSGYITTADSGSVVVGKNLNTAVASGAIGTGIFDFSNTAGFDSSSGHVSTYEEFGFTTQNDLSGAGDSNKFVNFVGGDFGASANVTGGVLLTGTASGTTSTGRVSGIVLVRAGGVFTVGQSVTCAASGWAAVANSGDLIIGRAVAASAAGNSGSTFKIALNAATPHYATNCFDVQY